MGNARQSNLVFMESCPVENSQIPDLPKNVSHGVAVVVPSDGLTLPSVLFCGGLLPKTGYSSKCFGYELDGFNDIRESAFGETSEWTEEVSLRTPRANAAITLLDRNDAALFGQTARVWVTGGRSSKKVVLDSSEILEKVDGTWTVTEGPKLVDPIASHCAVEVNKPSSQQQTFVIGGGYFDSSLNKFVRRADVTMYEGLESSKERPLKTPRSGHACTLVSEGDEPTGIMVAGGLKESREMLDSVEFLDLTRKDWIELAPLPRKLTGAKMIMKLRVPTLIGGTGYPAGKLSRQVSELEFSKDILAYKEDGWPAWTKIGEVLETVAYHDVLSLDSDICLSIETETRKITQATEGPAVFDDGLDIR